MPVSLEGANQLSLKLISLMKQLKGVRAVMPRIHPAVETAAYPIMFNLVDGPRRVSALAELVHSDASTVSRQTSSLAQHGLLVKLPDPEDGRASMLSLTDEGAELVARLGQLRGEWFKDMLQGWDPRDVAHFSLCLDRLSQSCETSRERLLRTASTTKEHHV